MGALSEPPQGEWLQIAGRMLHSEERLKTAHTHLRIPWQTSPGGLHPQATELSPPLPWFGWLTLYVRLGGSVLRVDLPNEYRRELVSFLCSGPCPDFWWLPVGSPPCSVGPLSQSVGPVRLACLELLIADDIPDPSWTILRVQSDPLVRRDT